MTALTQYDRLEASGLWRASPEEQRRDVIVSVGEATLTISDLKDTPLTHWSLAALNRTNPGEFPAIYAPDGDPGETLEIAESEAAMIAAIEKLRIAIDRARPHPGRLRWVSMIGISLALIATILFWVPGALMRHTVSVVPDIKRQAIGQSLLGRIERVAGSSCLTADTAPVLTKLARRTGARKIIVLSTGVPDSRHLPGGIILVNKSLIEDHEDPAVLAGYILAEQIRAATDDPLARMLKEGGPAASFRLLTSGQVAQDTLDAYAEKVMVSDRPPVPPDLVVSVFAEAGVPTTPFAYAQDVTGESVLALIEADPMTGETPAPVLPDRDWVLLQNICGG